MTKRGYIVRHNYQYVVAEKSKRFFDYCRFLYDGEYYTNPFPIHPDSLPTILDGDNLKPAYQGEVEYEVVSGCTCDNAGMFSSCIHFDSRIGCSKSKTTYAIPKVSEDNAHNFKHSKIADIRNKLTPLLTLSDIVTLECEDWRCSIDLNELSKTCRSSVKHICTVLDSLEVSEDKGDVWEEVADIMRELPCSNLAIERCKGLFTLTKI